MPIILITKMKKILGFLNIPNAFIFQEDYELDKKITKIKQN